MALNPVVKKGLILSGKLGLPLVLTYGTIKLGVWGSAEESKPVTSQIRSVLPDLSAATDSLPDLGDYNRALKRTWNRGVGASTAAVAGIPTAIDSGLTKAKESIFGKSE